MSPDIAGHVRASFTIKSQKVGNKIRRRCEEAVCLTDSRSFGRRFTSCVRQGFVVLTELTSIASRPVLDRAITGQEQRHQKPLKAMMGAGLAMITF
jgi:hypothetical protein